MTASQQQIQLARRPQGIPVHEDFRFETIPVPEPKQGKCLSKRFMYRLTLICAAVCRIRSHMLSRSPWIKRFLEGYR